MVATPSELMRTILVKKIQSDNVENDENLQEKTHINASIAE